MKRYRYSELSREQVKELCRRPRMESGRMLEAVQPILQRVAAEGDKALREYTSRFDGVDPQPHVIAPRPAEAIELDEATRRALQTAFNNITRFHEAQRPETITLETTPGVTCYRVPRPIERVGLYVPGGSAVLPSTMLMLGAPARIAGCREIVVATPPRADGSIHPEVEYCASLAGATHLVKAGGAQAVAALSYGTEQVPKVDKVFGPGNQYVTAAKMWLQNSDALISVDLPAGPSEVLVVADGSARPELVAADLLSQAEHGEDSQVVLAGVEGFDYEELDRQLQYQCQVLPRAEIAGRAIENSFIVQTGTAEQALAFSNDYAPEHLILNCRKARELAGQVQHAGSVFIGPWSPESAGDYASGTNHTLPTYGYARMYGGVSLDSFFKHITMQELSQSGLEQLSGTVIRMAEVEELEAHAEAVRRRLDGRE